MLEPAGQPEKLIVGEEHFAVFNNALIAAFLMNPPALSVYLAFMDGHSTIERFKGDQLEIIEGFLDPNGNFVKFSAARMVELPEVPPDTPSPIFQNVDVYLNPSAVTYVRGPSIDPPITFADVCTT